MSKYYSHHINQNQSGLNESCQNITSRNIGLKNNVFNKKLNKSNQLSKTLSKQKYKNTKNKQILANKLLDKLKIFSDDISVSLVTSIPILYAGNLVQIIKSVEQVEELLNQTWKNHQMRMRNQAKFIYHLWQIIGQEQVPTLKLKQIIYLFHAKKGEQLKIILAEMFGDSLDLQKLYCIWKQLSTDSMYYRQWSNKRLENSLNKTTKFDYNNKLGQQNSGMHKSREKFNKTTTNNYSFSDHKRVALRQNKINISKQVDFNPSVFTSLSSSSKQKNMVKKQSVNRLRKKSSNKKISKRFHTENSENIVNFSNCFSESSDSQNQSLNATFTRLYDKQFYRSKQKVREQQQKRKKLQQLQYCTFKPALCGYQSTSTSGMKTIDSMNINSLSCIESAMNQSNKTGSKQRSNGKIKGYDKTVNRLKDGYKKQLQRKKRMNYINVGQNYDKIKQKGSNPPKFLQRTQQNKTNQFLFSIGFQISNRKTILKIREADTSVSAAAKICQIYGLNTDKFQKDIEEIIDKQMKEYYSNIQNNRIKQINE